MTNKVELYEMKAICKKLAKRYYYPKYNILFYDNPTPYAEMGQVDSDGAISNYRPLSILLLRNMLESINEFMGESSNINFKNTIPKNVLYVKTSPSPFICFYNTYFNKEICHGDSKYVIKALNIMYFLTRDDIVVYRYNQINDKDVLKTKLFELELPNIFSNRICTGNTRYKPINHKYWEDVMENAEDFLFDTKFSNTLNSSQIKKLNTKILKNKESWILEKVLKEYIS